MSANDVGLYYGELTRSPTWLKSNSTLVAIAPNLLNNPELDLH